MYVHFTLTIIYVFQILSTSTIEMPNKYAAVNCTSGYSYSKKGDVSEEEKEISFHKFPLRNPDLLRSWLHRLSLEGFVPTENSRLCSKHFVDGDFIKVSMDETEKPNYLLLVYQGQTRGVTGVAQPPGLSMYLSNALSIKM